MKFVVVLTAVLFSAFVSPAAAAPGTLDEGLNRVVSGVGSVVEQPGASPPPVPELPVLSPKPGDGSVKNEDPPDPAPQPRLPSPIEPSGAPDPVAAVPGSGSLRRTPGADAAAGADPGAQVKGAAPNPAQTGARPGRPARVGSGAGSSDSAPGSIRAAMPAPLEEWLAHLWPAVALGPVGSALTAQLAVLAPSLLLPGLSVFSQPFLPPNDAPTGGGPTAPPTAQTASPDSHSFFSPDSGGMSFLITVITVLATLVGLVALARLTYGDDFFSMRWLR